ncbi:MAG: elongation factor P [Elusimicrobiota bacterium]
MTVDTSGFFTGLNIEVDGEIYTIVWFQHHKPGKGGAVMRTRMRNLKTGAIVERTFKSGEKFREVELERRKKDYMYNDGKNYYFMDTETYEQIEISKERLGESAKFLKENCKVEGLYLDGNYIGIELPINVELKVTDTVPGVRGDTVSNVTKPATLETGAEIKVPLFIKPGDVVKVDTRRGEYVERVS